MTEPGWRESREDTQAPRSRLRTGRTLKRRISLGLSSSSQHSFMIGGVLDPKKKLTVFKCKVPVIQGEIVKISIERGTKHARTVEAYIGCPRVDGMVRHLIRKLLNRLVGAESDREQFGVPAQSEEGGQKADRRNAGTGTRHKPSEGRPGGAWFISRYTVKDIRDSETLDDFPYDLKTVAKCRSLNDN